ncbi:MAG: carboxymuconolactone decarboxylase family protein [Emcibacter sp.]|nr:carboxymuconolactone decarboxylase family protein [Emcibacter sp.]
MTNTLLSRVQRDDLPENLRESWDFLNGRTGEPTFVEVFAQAPELLTFVMGDFYKNIFYEGRVQMKYKELARLKLSFSHGCNTCIRQNVPGCKEAGFTDEQIDAIDSYEDGPFSDAEKAVLAYTEEMVLTNLGGALTPELYKRLKKHFSDPEILELGTCMAVIGGMAKLSFVLDLVVKEDSCPFVAKGGA